MSILNCTATSGDQALCNEFLYCDGLLPLPYNKAYNDCVAFYNPNGIGCCTENEELYHSAEYRELINNCIERQVNVEELTDSELTEVDQFQDCMRQLSRKCFGRMF
ncbi:hypothetical protein HNY73_002758 [Argiope bruennichi]|uniref:Uncharacterized protein n=2 Tax=Argiope bruennichi TaxID=94029 RepID=A0A8T0FUQ3_ARGBR|nr:hypothetical protein HNY73_002758 [Argiope bruennichi]